MESGGIKKVIYTAIFGNYNGLIPQPALAGFDFVCFTDNPGYKANPWQLRIVQPHFPGDLTRSNRIYKILPHRFLPEYEMSIYIDGNFLITGNLNELTEKFLKDYQMAAFSHQNTIPDSRDCIYDEYKAILELTRKDGIPRDDPETMKRFIELLKAEKYPLHNGLIKGGCLLRKHNDAAVIEVMETWWRLVEKFSKRDQLSFNYAAWKNNFEYAEIPGNIRRGNPWIYWMGSHRKHWTLKLLKVKLKRKLGLFKVTES